MRSVLLVKNIRLFLKLIFVHYVITNKIIDNEDNININGEKIYDIQTNVKINKKMLRI